MGYFTGILSKIKTSHVHWFFLRPTPNLSPLHWHNLERVPTQVYVLLFLLCFRTVSQLKNCVRPTWVCPHLISPHLLPHHFHPTLKPHPRQWAPLFGVLPAFVQASSACLLPNKLVIFQDISWRALHGEVSLNLLGKQKSLLWTSVVS